MVFAELLKKHRTEAGLTQTALAEATGLKQANISQYEKGVHEPSWSSVQAIAKALGVPVTAFLEGEGSGSLSHPDSDLGDRPDHTPGSPGGAKKGAAKKGTKPKRKVADS